MNRRRFLGSLAGFAAAMTMDPERLLWVPGKKTIVVMPALKEWNPNLDLINEMTMKYIRDSRLVDQVFAGIPWLRVSEGFGR